MWYGVTWAGSIQETMKTWETEQGMDGSQISQWSNIPVALAMLTSWCVIGQSLWAQIDTNIQDTLTQIWLTLTKEQAPKYYSSYQQRHDAAITYRLDAQYCAYKIAAYRLQYHFYQVYQWTAKAINPLQSSTSYRTKYFAALKKLNRYKVPKQIEPYLKISVSNKSDILKMNATSKRVVADMSNLYRGIVGEALYRLQQDGILSQADVEAVGSKIFFNYVQQCSNLRWLTKVKLSRTSTGRLVSGSLVSITLNVNVCEDMSYLGSFDQHVKDLVYHEIAHYIYYLTDPTTANFESICTSSDAKNLCLRKDYVSDYAMTAAEEDYAETFQFWYQKTVTPKANTKLSQKFDYFNVLFERP
jgi:hypothetical protein